MTRLASLTWNDNISKIQVNTDRCKREVNYYFYVPYPEQRGLPELLSRARHGGAGEPALISASGWRAWAGRTSAALYWGQMKDSEERWVGGSESQARWGDGSERVLFVWGGGMQMRIQ